MLTEYGLSIPAAMSPRLAEPTPSPVAATVLEPTSMFSPPPRSTATWMTTFCATPAPVLRETPLTTIAPPLRLALSDWESSLGVRAPITKPAVPAAATTTNDTSATAITRIVRLSSVPSMATVSDEGAGGVTPSRLSAPAARALRSPRRGLLPGRERVGDLDRLGGRPVVTAAMVVLACNVVPTAGERPVQGQGQEHALLRVEPADGWRDDPGDRLPARGGIGPGA